MTELAVRRWSGYGAVVPLLLCDLDGTLLDRAEALERWAGQFLADRRAPAQRLAWLIEQDRDGFRQKTELFTVVRAELGLDDDVEELAAGFYRDFPSYLRLEDEVAAGLVELRAAGWKIVIVTNGGPSQLNKITATGLEAYVDGIAVSAIVGSAKPDPEIFRYAADQGDAELAGAWVVGDTAAADIAGAAGLGLDSVWISRGRQWQEAGFAPTAIASTFAAAAATLRNRC